MITVKLQYKNDTSVYVIFRNIVSVTYRENLVFGPDFLMNFPDDYHIAFSAENWSIVETW